MMPQPVNKPFVLDRFFFYDLTFFFFGRLWYWSGLTFLLYFGLTLAEVIFFGSFQEITRSFLFYRFINNLSKLGFSCLNVLLFQTDLTLLKRRFRNVGDLLHDNLLRILNNYGTHRRVIVQTDNFRFLFCVDLLYW